MKQLALYPIERIDELTSPEAHEDISMLSSAINVFTDFKNVTPQVIESSTSAVNVEHLMQKSHVRLKLVIDNKNRFIGLISFESLQNQEILKRVAAGHQREQLTVADFMIPKEQLKAIDFDDLSYARIGDVIETLQSAGQQHCLVLDRENHTIRGVLSANDIARRLKLAVDVSTPNSFASIFDVITKNQQPVGLKVP
ncbi:MULTISPECIES: CBS domain-containing protein [Shewanella]|uniref:CBS domain-containing protein n=1 Tax=Shewanella polaris TaxID=2588449 RepID=A0A4Y5YD79_9GAMM|nr:MULTISPECIES: CBS domain-containing protein [Shewanella]QDE30634.1 CBS domain-containing protein [Shewanella polaris]